MKKYGPPPSLSVHAECFWEFTPAERRVMTQALINYIGEINRNSKEYRIASMLFDALNELSTQD